jgi:hypothetical protein
MFLAFWLKLRDKWFHKDNWYICAAGAFILPFLYMTSKVATLKFHFIHVPLPVFGFVQKQMDPLNNTQDGRRHRRERERFEHDRAND